MILRRRQLQKSLLVLKFTCKIKNGISVKDIDTSDYIVVWAIYHHTNASICPNMQFLSAQQYAYQPLLGYFLV